MDRLFRNLPLQAKLSLIGVVPLIFLVYLSARYYLEKDKSARRVEQSISFVKQNISVSRLIDELQQERRLSFEKALNLAKDSELERQYKKTDSLIHLLNSSGSFHGFTKYTFLDSLSLIRERLERGLHQDILMHFYSTVIFRLGTLSNISPFESQFLKPVYSDLLAQRLLSEMSNYLGILRSNIYNVLYTKQNAIGTLYGLIGVYDIYKSFETEFLFKASPETKHRFEVLRKDPNFQSTSQYLSGLFQRMAFDSTYNAETWWLASGGVKDELRALEGSLVAGTIDKLNNLYEKELSIKGRTLVSLVISIMIVITLVIYTIRVLTTTLREMKTAARQLAKGQTGVELTVDTKDALGSLARSIRLIDNNYKKLADTAAEIGKGNFDVEVNPRGPRDILAIALIDMKSDLEELNRQQKMRQQIIASAVLTAQERERTRLGEELHDNVNQMLASVKLYIQMMQDKKHLQGDLFPKAIENISYAINEIRNISHRLILPSLRGETLLESINVLLEDIKLISPIRIYLEVKEFDEERLNEAQKIAVYRIVQEQLNNILKYSSASTAAIHLKNNDGKFFLFIEDNGKGFDLKSRRKGVGISNIINRAELLNGRVQIDTSPGNGCRLKVLLETSVN